MPFVIVVILAAAVGASGASLSIFVTSNVVTSDTLPAASVPRKYAVPLSVNVTASVYDCQVSPSRLYSFVTESALN